MRKIRQETVLRIVEFWRSWRRAKTLCGAAACRMTWTQQQRGLVRDYIIWEETGKLREDGKQGGERKNSVCCLSLGLIAKVMEMCGRLVG